jgi:glutamine synthetase
MPTTAKIDPFFKVPTLVLICNIADPITREAYTRDPRNIAKKVEAYLKSTGIGDTAFIGPEAEFFIFDDIRYEVRPTVPSMPSIPWKAPGTPAAVKSPTWATSRATKKATSPYRPSDKFQDLRTEMLLTLESLGIDVECQHHEVATAGQAEIDMRFKPLLQMSDQLMWFKYVLKNVA